MRKEDYLKTNYTDLEEAAREASKYLWLCRKTEEMIRELALHECYYGWTDEDVSRCIREAGTFDFSLDDVRYIHEIAQDEWMKDTQKSIDYLFNEMAVNFSPEDRMWFYETNVKPNIKARDTYRRGFLYNFQDAVYYKMPQ